MSEGPAPPHPAATVILLRDAPGGCETLLVRRDRRLAFHGGAWVFPGGRIDPEDWAYPDVGGDVVRAARHAAVREAAEETGLEMAAERLVLVSRWITPEVLPKRFDTWFFAAEAPEGEVVVDDGEIRAFRWIRAEEALAARNAQQIELPPPTFVTLSQLARFRHARDALRALAQDEPVTFAPRLCHVEGGAIMLYPGDVAYESGEISAPGARDRLVIVGDLWRYECGSGSGGRD